MRSRWKSLLALCVLLMVFAVVVFAEDWQMVGNLRWKIENETLFIEGSGAIPDFSAQFESPWGENNDEIKKIEIAGGVTGIGNRSFMGLGRLTEVVVPASVTTVGSLAFLNASALTSVSMTGVVTVGEKAFKDCSQLRSVDLPAAKTVGVGAFSGCGNLTTLNLPSLESAAADAFPDVSGLTLSCPCTNAEALKDSGCTVVLLHAYEKVPAVPASATKDGWTEGSRCTRCGAWEPGHEPQVIPAGSDQDGLVTAIRLNKTKATLYARKSTADTLQLTAAVIPADAKDKRIRWTSSDLKIAKVNQNGLVQVVTRQKGTCSIIAEAMDGSGVRASFTLTVKKNAAKLRKLAPVKKQLTLKAGKSASVKIKLTPSTAYNNKLKWVSSDRRIATVTSKGVIKAVGKGKCVITATATDGTGKKATIKVTVK